MAPNPVRYTDAIIAAILGQWSGVGAGAGPAESEPGTALVEVDFTTEEEERSSLFAEFMQQARDLKLLKINVDTAIIALLTKFAALNPSELQADLLRNAIHKATGVTRTTLRGMWKTILAKAQRRRRRTQKRRTATGGASRARSASGARTARATRPPMGLVQEYRREPDAAQGHGGSGAPAWRRQRGRWDPLGLSWVHQPSCH